MQRQAIALSQQIPNPNMMRVLWLGVLALAFVLVQAMMAQARSDSFAPLAE